MLGPVLGQQFEAGCAALKNRSVQFSVWMLTLSAPVRLKGYSVLEHVWEEVRGHTGGLLSCLWTLLSPKEPLSTSSRSEELCW